MKLKIIHILLILVLFLLTPKNIFAQGEGGTLPCACGTTPDGLDCMTCGIPGDIPSWQCDGPNDCPGGCCLGGVCGACAPVCAFSKIDCPAGTVKSTTVKASECRRKLCNIGTAQTIGNCCEYATRPRVCGDWYDCPTRNNPNKMCRDCEPEETYCVSTRVTTYECTPICTATAPSNVNYSNNTLTWTTGSGGVSQQLYVSTTQSDVTNNCGTGSNCVVNAVLPATASSYPFSSAALTPDTIYYVKIATFKDATCAPYTIYGFITPLSNNAWWQVKDGDISTNGSIMSDVPSGQLFNTVGLGGFPGVPVYGTGLSTNPGEISDRLWNANTTTNTARLFDYSYFKNLVPDGISPEVATMYDGYIWLIIDGDYSLPPTNIGTDKVIMFINGNLTLEGNVFVTDNQGMFAVFASGNISVEPTTTGAPSIEGLYLTDGVFETGTQGVGLDSQLHVRGSIVAHGGILMQRDLPDNNTFPAELFEFAPDQILLFPDKLGFRGQKWLEIAP